MNHAIRTAVVLSATALGAGVAACSDSGMMDRALVFGSLDDAQRELERLMRAQTLRSDAAWNWPQTLSHCAQSIEYSITGFPQAKPTWFQNSVGALAFNVFAWRGRMAHDLADPIPGAPPLPAGLDREQAASRLLAAIQAFRAATQPPRPHFAYGELDQSRYAMAHAMHLANHFSAFDGAA